MPVLFEEILFDLELKRAAALERAGSSACSTGVPHGLAELRVSLDGAEADAMPIVAELTLAALTTLALARGDDGDRPGQSDTVSLVAGRVAERLARGAADGLLELTTYDLSVIVEAALIELREFDLAKALVLSRTASSGARPSTTAEAPRLIRRSGQVVAWNGAKIEQAVRKAFISSGLDSAPAAAIATRVSERARTVGSSYIPIELVQDIVQEELVFSGNMRVAERYIVYRAERALLRAGSEPEGPSGCEPITVLEADGREVVWTATTSSSGSGSR